MSLQLHWPRYYPDRHTSYDECLEEEINLPSRVRILHNSTSPLRIVIYG